MNIRQKSILKLLMTTQEISVDEISAVFSVAPRTIRYDIEEINDQIKVIDNSLDISIVDNWIRFDFNQEFESEILQSVFKTQDYYLEKISSEERVLLILFDMCWSNEIFTNQYFMDKFFVSRTTINSDLIKVKEYCEENEIQFVSKRGLGFYIEASEKQRRQFITKILRRYSSITRIDSSFKSELYANWFDISKLDDISVIVADAEVKHNVYLTEVAFEALVVHIALSIQRFENSKTITYVGNGQFIANDIQSKMAITIIDEVNKKFDIELPSSEVEYIAIHLGAKSSEIAFIEGDPLLEYYCIQMITNVGKLVEKDLRYDQKLYRGLLQHLSAGIYRKKNRLTLENPLKDELIEKYHDEFQLIKAVVQDVNMPDLIDVNDDEITYILLHFLTSFNRLTQGNPIPKVIIVCATGIGTAQLVESRLQGAVNVEVVHKASIHQLDSFLLKDEIDLIVSTVPINASIKSVRVHPLVNDEDLLRIKEALNQLGFETKQKTSSVEKISKVGNLITDLVKQHPNEDQSKQLISELEQLIIKLKRTITPTKGVFMLSELLNEKNIRLNVSCTNWEEAIRQSGEVLLEQDLITQEYINASINNTKELGPYIVITKGVALPHASNKKGVNQSAISLISLKEPVEFGNDHNDPVKYVFMLASTDATSHLGALSDLAEFLDKPDFREQIDEAKSPQDVMDYILKHETKVSETKVSLE